MLLEKMKKLEGFLEDAFKDGVYFRELRLSTEEAAYIKEKYPKATLRQCNRKVDADGKTWWEINLLGKEKVTVKEVIEEEKEASIKTGA